LFIVCGSMGASLPGSVVPICTTSLRVQKVYPFQFIKNAASRRAEPHEFCEQLHRVRAVVAVGEEIEQVPWPRDEILRHHEQRDEPAEQGRREAASVVPQRVGAERDEHHSGGTIGNTA